MDDFRNIQIDSEPADREGKIRRVILLAIKSALTGAVSLEQGGLIGAKVFDQLKAAHMLNLAPSAVQPMNEAQRNVDLHGKTVASIEKAVESVPDPISEKLSIADGRRLAEHIVWRLQEDGVIDPPDFVAAEYVEI